MLEVTRLELSTTDLQISDSVINTLSSSSPLSTHALIYPERFNILVLAVSGRPGILVINQLYIPISALTLLVG